ncbi:MAG: sulfurtransferase [Geminicoccaceae bacterium]
MAGTQAGPLVDAAWLADHHQNDRLRVLDIRTEREEAPESLFEAGHIPGSVHADYAAAGWRVEVDGVVGLLPKEDHLERLIGGLGIANDHHVVVVSAGTDASDFGGAARVYWTFKVMGHDQVSILDGGYQAWQADPKRPIATGASDAIEPVSFDASFDPSLIVTTDEVAERVESGQSWLVDVRPPEQFDGGKKHPKAKQAGRLEGAQSLDQATLFDPNASRIREPDELAELVPPGILDDGREVVSYCNTGHWAATNWFVMSELLGRDDVRLYDGSMVGWTADPDRPVIR